MSIEEFLPVAVVIGVILVVGTLLYAIFYALHASVAAKFGAPGLWPLLALYAVLAVIGFAGAALTWNGALDGEQYGFYGDGDNPRRVLSFLLLGVLSVLLLLSARHAASATKSAKAKT